MRNRIVVPILILVAAIVAGVFVGNTFFGSKPEETATPNPSPSITRQGETGVIQVLATTMPWGSIVEEIGGDWVEVTVLIDDLNKDPHSYEATARDQLAIQDADLIVYNGGGYDNFVEELVTNTETEEPKILVSAISLESGEVFEGNEHVWFDLAVIGTTAETIAKTLSEMRPEAFAEINKNFDEFMIELDNLETRSEALREKALGLGVISSEPVGDLLLEDAGFTNMTPSGLSEAVEEEREVSPADLKTASDLLAGKVAILLVTNAQTADATAAALSKTAAEAGLPEISLYESLPEGLSYLDYMNSVIDQLQEAIY
jgi:zinc/manganese transport system substrate-binding protein